MNFHFNSYSPVVHGRSDDRHITARTSRHHRSTAYLTALGIAAGLLSLWAGLCVL